MILLVNKFRKIFLTTLVSMSICSCAPNTTNIKAFPASSTKYQNHSCEQLNQEISQLDTSLVPISNEINDKAVEKGGERLGKGIGTATVMLVYWPLIPFMLADPKFKKEVMGGADGSKEASKETKDKYATIKGEIEVIEEIAKGKGSECSNLIAKTRNSIYRKELARKTSEYDARNGAKNKPSLDLNDRQNCLGLCEISANACVQQLRSEFGSTGVATCYEQGIVCKLHCK